jgi:DNA modification methylase
MKKTPIIIGSVFRLGDHLLACGDSTDETFVRRVLKKSQVSLVVTDPPYGIAYVEGKEGFTNSKVKHAVIANDHIQNDDEYRKFTRSWIEAVRPHLTKKNAFYIFNSDKMLFALREGMRDSGCHFAQLLIWVKTQAIIGRLDYLPQHELLIYGWVRTHSFHRSKDKSVIVYPKPARSKAHPTMKPIGLLRPLILNSSRTGEIVFDPFLGSGSTLLACEQTKRRCTGIELDPTYCGVVIERYEKLTGQKAEALPSLSHL